MNNITPDLTSKLENWTCSANVYDNNSWSGWRNTSVLTIYNRKPEVPTLDYPENGSYFAVNNSLINWTVLDIDNDNMSCYVYGQNVSDPINIINVTDYIINGSQSWFSWKGLNDSIYYWKVRCDDGTENSSFSEMGR